MATVTIKFRRKHSDDWAVRNPVLAQGEPGYEIDTGKLKIGDGVHEWSDLEYISPGNYVPDPTDVPVTYEDLQNHENSLEPHPVYDYGPSLTTLYQNAKV